MMCVRRLSSIFFLFLMVCVQIPYASIVHADTASDAADLQAKIDARNSQIKQLQDEIDAYNTAASQADTVAKTLQGTLQVLNLTQKKISTDINLTQQKIAKAGLTIEQLGNQITFAEKNIADARAGIIEAIQNTDKLEHVSLFETILSEKTVDDVWNDIENTRQVHREIAARADTLKKLTVDLQAKQDSMTGQKQSLVVLQKDLTGKKQAVTATAEEKTTLLTQTKNQEQTYKKMVQDREKQKAQFEKEVYDFESQLHLSVNTNSYPAPHQGILSWPLDDVLITQKFGKTVGAEKLYVSGSHNGVDFRATIGTKVKNVLDGVVAGTGNTDAYPGCYSFGKWVMVKHSNGLSTIYGHLSVISVNQGDQLKTGDTIGFSGNTGYSTGPHLHISVYATEGVRIEKYVNSRGCKQAIIPLADIKAYLDPLAYFPSM